VKNTNVGVLLVLKRIRERELPAHSSRAVEKNDATERPVPKPYAFKARDRLQLKRGKKKRRTHVRKLPSSKHYHAGQRRKEVEECHSFRVIVQAGGPGEREEKDVAGTHMRKG